MISLIIPTYNPNPEFMKRTLDALKEQSLPREEWELIVIDNASPAPVASDLVDWHPNGRVVREDQIGLTHARLRAIREARHELMVWVDDDNLLVPGYLENVRKIFTKHPKLGAAGGPSIAEYQEELPDWFEEGLAPIGCRDLGDEELIAKWDEENPDYPKCAPIGAGMVTRTELIKIWAEKTQKDPVRLALGRTGDKLTSGEDNDMTLVIMREGYDVGYFPQLKLTHLIPGGRTSLEYQKKIARVAFRDFICVLNIHGIRPWPPIPSWSVAPRSLKAWFATKAWQSPANAVRWQGLVGQLEGRASL